MAIAVAQSVTAVEGTSADLTFTPPSGAPSDNSFLLVAIFVNSASTTVSAPAGWTQVYDLTEPRDGADRQLGFYKIASSEGSSYTFTKDGSGVGVFAEFTGVDTTTPFTGVGFSTRFNSGDSPAPDAHPLVADQMAVLIPTHQEGANITPPTGYTEQEDNGTTHHVSMHTKTISSAGHDAVEELASGTSPNWITSLWTLLPSGVSLPAADRPRIRAVSISVREAGDQHEVFVPAGLDEGSDLLVGVWNNQEASGVNTAPSGWSEVHVIDHSTFGTQAVYHRVSQAGDGGSTATVVWDNDGEAMNVVAAIYNGTTPDADSSNTGTSTTPTATGITTLVDNSLLLAAFSIEDSAVVTAPSSMDSVLVYEDSNITGIAIGDFQEVQSAAGSSGDKQASIPSSVDWMASLVSIPPANLKPNAPSLDAPSDGGTVDFANDNVTFDWTFSDPDSGDTQSAYYFRRKTSGGSYEYWNESTSSWQASEVKNSTSTTEKTFNAGTGGWSNGTTYNWSIATEDSEGAKGPYASDFTVTGGNTPTVTVDAPSGTIGGNEPLIEWTYSDSDGDAQASYRVVVESGSFGSTPGSGTTVEDTGTVSSSDKSYQTTETLSDNTSYRVFVRATDATGLTSDWATSDFTVDLNPPATPTLTVTAQPSSGRVKLDVQGHDNLLSENQADIETDLTGWNAGTGALARSTDQARNGSASLELTNNTGSSADLNATTDSGTSGVAVQSGDTYTAMAWFRDGGTTRNVLVYVFWYDSGGSFLSTSAGSQATETSSTFTQATVTDTAPANAAFAALRVEVKSAANTEVHYVDTIAIVPDPNSDQTAWFRGGIASSATFRLERSEDGGTTFETVRGGSSLSHDGAATQQATLHDYEAPPGTQLTYKATTRAEI